MKGVKPERMLKCVGCNHAQSSHVWLDGLWLCEDGAPSPGWRRIKASVMRQSTSFSADEIHCLDSLLRAVALRRDTDVISRRPELHSVTRKVTAARDRMRALQEQEQER